VPAGAPASGRATVALGVAAGGRGDASEARRGCVAAGGPAGCRAIAREYRERRGHSHNVTEGDGNSACVPSGPERRHLLYHVCMPDDCLFCRIAAGTSEASIVYDDETSVAFLDSRPLFAGHTLLIPRRHVETLGDLPASQIEPLFANAQAVCRAVEEALGAEGTFVAINNRVSQSVPHLHIHVVPRRKKDGLRGFFWPRIKYRDPTEAESVRIALRKAIIRWKTSVKR
jgi:histidine triad (HIT) family protein